MPQERKAPTRKSAESPASEEAAEVAPETDVSERKEALDDDVDAILEEIDDVLETNAEDFVKSFIQKGGQ
jgi:ubiquitin-like protein Pup